MANASPNGSAAGKALSGRAVHIVGLGLMGGSLALALRGQVARLTAADLCAGVLADACRMGAIDATQDSARGADLVVLAIPADQIVAQVAALDVSPGALVIDLGSTKTQICAALDRLPVGVAAVGGHPMCGLAENGWQHATPTLYRGARFVLCETARTTSAARDLAEALVTAIGAQPLWLDRRRHDELTALTSHLPHLLSFALMRLAMARAAEDGEVFALAAGGFDGATRLARTTEGMIAGMFSTNAAELRRAAAGLRAQLDALDALLDDAPALRHELGAIVEARRAYTAAYGERMIT